MTFEEYCSSKNIDYLKFKLNEPDNLSELENIFNQLHPKSFTQQKLFVINKIRRQYQLPIKPKEKKEVLEKNVEIKTTTAPVEVEKTPVSEISPAVKPAIKPVFKPKIPNISTEKSTNDIETPTENIQETPKPVAKPVIKPKIPSLAKPKSEEIEVPSNTIAKKPIIKPVIKPKNTEPVQEQNPQASVEEITNEKPALKKPMIKPVIKTPVSETNQEKEQSNIDEENLPEKPVMKKPIIKPIIKKK